MDWFNAHILGFNIQTLAVILLLAWLLLSSVVVYKYRSGSVSKARTVLIISLAAGWIAYSLPEANVFIGLPRRLVDVLFILGGIIMFGGFGYELWLKRNTTG